MFGIYKSVSFQREDLPDTTDTSDQAGGDEEDEEPGMEEGSFIPTLTTALQNLEQGHITPDQFAEYMTAEIGEVYHEQAGKRNG